MTDQTPLQVNASPTPDQIAALIRQLLLVASTAATALGAVGWAGRFNELAVGAGPLAGLIVIWLGQVKTRKSAQTVAKLAAVAPDSVAQIKGT